MGYDREDIRSCCDVWAVGWWCGPLALGDCTWYTQAAHDESPVSGDGARSHGVVQDNFCLSELVAV